MDAEKDNHLPQKSPSFDSKNTNMDNAEKEDESFPEKSPGDNTKSDDQTNHPEKSSAADNAKSDQTNDVSECHPDEKPNGDQDPDHPQDDNGVGNPSSPKSPSKAAVADDDAPKSEIKEESEEPSDETKLEEEPSVLPPDLDKVSEEIDQYISSLLNLQGGDDEVEGPTPADVPIFVEQFIVLVEAKIDIYDSPGDALVKWSRLTEEDSASFLEAVNRVSSLSNVLSRFSTEYKCAGSVNLIGGVLQRAMSFLEEEFRAILENNKIQLNSDQDNKRQDQDPNPDDPESNILALEDKSISGYSEKTVSDLISLSKAMISGGYETECCQVYFVARRSALEEILHRLRFEKHSIDDVHKMHWETLEREIEAWIKTLKQFASVHFPDERKLSDTVFSGHTPPISDGLFGSLSYGVTIQLLNFAEAVALTKRASEKLFKFLDVYEALRDNLQSIDKLFAEEWVIEIKTETSMIRSRLGEAMISIFVELENSIRADSGKNQVPGGAVHPLTKYTMNYLEYACEYKDTLEQVFREHQKIERADSATGSEFDYNSSQNQNNVQPPKQSPFQAQIIKVMDLLDANVEGKSKLYKDPSLSSIFMMNNGRYILKKIKGSSQLNALMGETWYRRKSSDLRQYHKGYQRETWGKLLSCFHPEGLTSNGKVVKPVLKERFKSFNQMFDEIHKTQSSWVVGDEQLQSELRVSVSNMVIPAYRSFLGRYSQVFTPGRQTQKYVKYQPEDIETYIDELFDGNATPMGRKKL